MRISDWSSDVCSSDLWLDSKQKSGPRTAYFNLAGVAWQPARLRLRGNVGWSGAGTEIYAYLNYIDGVEDRRTLPYRDGSAMITADLSLGHTVSSESRWLNGLKAQIVVNNILDQRPPRSEEHTSELQSIMRISYAVFCL